MFGVPYGTHMWQVHDSPQLNGAFQKGPTEAKREMLNVKIQMGQNFEASDIIPLVSKAWDSSFGNKENELKAIAA